MRAARHLLAWPIRLLAWCFVGLGFAGTRSARALGDLADAIEGTT